MECIMRSETRGIRSFLRLNWPVGIVLAVWLLAFSLVVLEAEGDIVLTVEGPEYRQPVTYTRLRIRTLPQSSFTTFDQWDRQRRTYTGVSLMALLEDIGYKNGTRLVEIVSRNNYRVSIDLNDIRNYGHMLSYRMDDRDYADLPESNKGPLAIAVNIEDLAEQERRRISEQVVWWIERIIVR